MRGPYERLKYDLRRLWECPVCKRRERTPGSVTFKHCLCQMQQLDGQPVVMKLVEDGVQRVAPPVVVRHEAAEEQEPGVGSQESGDRGQGSGDRGQGPGDRGQAPGAESQEPEGSAATLEGGAPQE